MEYIDFLDKIGMKSRTERLEKAYYEARYLPEIPSWLKEEFIDEVQRKYNLLPNLKDEVKEGLKEVTKYPDLVMFSKMMYCLIKPEGMLNELMAGIGDYAKAKSEDMKKAVYMAGVFPLLALMPWAIEYHKSHGVPDKIIQDTFSGFEKGLATGPDRMGYLGVDREYFYWLLLYKTGCLLRIGRFNFELCKAPKEVKLFKKNTGETLILNLNSKIHRSGQIFGSALCLDEEGAFGCSYTETDDYYEGNPIKENSTVSADKVRLNKSEWSSVISPGDYLLGIHIPGEGKLNKEESEKSIEEARTLYKEKFPEFDIKGFYTYTWLLGGELNNILKPESNIIAFQDMFKRFPMPSKGLDVFEFVFNSYKITKEEIKNLPENSSLQKGIKNLYLNGGVIYEAGGFIL
ncbi:MAG: acyltransferase domain-containing protein [Bacillota bacterium]|nr:acyltransferase domain-containing protein [Bacillota bacterium]